MLQQVQGVLTSPQSVTHLLYVLPLMQVGAQHALHDVMLLHPVRIVLATAEAHHESTRLRMVSSVSLQSKQVCTTCRSNTQLGA
jgi:hypothetical protein